MPSVLSHALFENIVISLALALIFGLFKLFNEVRDIKTTLIGLDGKNGMRQKLNNTSDLTEQLIRRVTILEARHE